MDDVARACGIARRTLFSYYPSKSAIVWDGRDQASAAIAAALADVPAATDWRTALARTLPAALVFPDGDEALLRARLRLMAATPDLRSHLFAVQFSVLDELAAFVADRAPGEDGLTVAVATQAALSAMTAGLLWWAANEGQELRPTLRRALEQVLENGRSRSRTHQPLQM